MEKCSLTIVMQSFQNAFERLVPPSLRTGNTLFFLGGAGKYIYPDEIYSSVLMLETSQCMEFLFLFFEPCDKIDILMHMISYS